MVPSNTGALLRDILHKRSDILDSLCDEPYTKPELVDIVETSRSTIDRAIDDLESVGLVRRLNSRYHPTYKGELAYDEYCSYKRMTDNLERSGAILNDLPDDAPISRQFLVGMDVHRGNQQVPEAVLAASTELLQTSTRLLGLAPTALSSYPAMIDEAVRKQGLSAEIVVESGVLESLSKISSSAVETLVSRDAVQLYQSDTSLPYALWVMEEPETATAGVTIYENGGIRGMLMNDSEDAVDWATNVYRQYRTAATPIDEDIVS